VEHAGFLTTKAAYSSEKNPRRLDRRRGEVRVWDMKATRFATFVALLMVGCGEEPGGDSPESNASSAEIPPDKTAEVAKVVVDWDQLEERDDLQYFEGKPFTGVAVAKYPNGKKEGEAAFKDGKMDGLATFWYENGQKEEEATWKDGKSHGLLTGWYENGQKEIESTHKDGKEDGLYTSWYEDGQKEDEVTWKDGKLDGLVTRWHPNGQKKEETTYKDGKSDGPSTNWWDNGQKEIESTWKADELISLKEWDKDGNLIKETP